MKRNHCLLLLISLLALTLAGCQNSAAVQPPKETLPLREAIEKALADKEEWVEYSGDDLYDLVGIGPQDYTEAVFLASSDSLSGREILAVRAKDAAALKKATDAMEAYLEQRKTETRNYLPDAYHLQSQARVESKSLSAALIIGPHADQETKVFLAGE